MSKKIWHKALHKRKIWKELSFYEKVRYYLQPFVEHLVDIWYQPLPFPTILKLLQSIIVILITLIPVIYPILLLMCTYAEFQYILNSHFNYQIPKTCDLVKYVTEVVEFQITDDAHAMFLALYLERYRLLVSALTSSIDYFRMACYLMLGFSD